MQEKLVFPLAIKVLCALVSPVNRSTEVIKSWNYFDFYSFNPTPYRQSNFFLIVYLHKLHHKKFLDFPMLIGMFFQEQTFCICVVGLEFFIFWSNFYVRTLFSMLRLVCSCLSGVSGGVKTLDSSRLLPLGSIT